LEIAAFVGSDPATPTTLVMMPTLGNVVQLVGYEWLTVPHAGEEAALLTCWRALDRGPSSSRYGEPALRTFVHLLDGGQQVVSGVDVLGAAPNTWRQGDFVVQLHRFMWPAAGQYAVELGWYVPPMGPRLTVRDVDAPGQRILLRPVEVIE
jgi:hypothetical protein